MLKSFVLFALVSGLVLTEVRAQDTTPISSADISFLFVSKEVDGSISGFESTSEIDLGNLKESKFSGSVQVESLKTGNFLRDWSLKGKKYFHADAYPKIHFESTDISETDEGNYLVKGRLTLKGITKPIVFQFERDGKRLVGTTTLFSSDFGIEINKDRNKNLVQVGIVLSLP
ncbi:YceI family protein [Pseudozobellia thermophila]|uniref:Polyisoprenoid-binding protein YceI n=1 Tax=Pseudozobellia thermophila TaxID=192903 RepID=A0A1M6PB18_9FLAO|nr:YceI family protein [Pseudozobellia thermophila]SHK05117.1 Polyisoprenoid-binding protein YceI [Pseudozobellia thermophila]